MESSMQASLQKAVQVILDRYSKNHPSDVVIHPAVAEAMAAAGAIVFDMSMNAQLVIKKKR